MVKYQEKINQVKGTQPQVTQGDLQSLIETASDQVAENMKTDILVSAVVKTVTDLKRGDYGKAASKALEVLKDYITQVEDSTRGLIDSKTDPKLLNGSIDVSSEQIV